MVCRPLQIQPPLTHAASHTDLSPCPSRAHTHRPPARLPRNFARSIYIISYYIILYCTILYCITRAHTQTSHASPSQTLNHSLCFTSSHTLSLTISLSISPPSLPPSLSLSLLLSQSLPPPSSSLPPPRPLSPTLTHSLTRTCTHVRCLSLNRLWFSSTKVCLSVSLSLISSFVSPSPSLPSSLYSLSLLSLWTGRCAPAPIRVASQEHRRVWQPRVRAG